MNAKYCDECKFRTDKYIGGKHFLEDINKPVSPYDLICTKGHRPRFYMPKTDNPNCNDWGWKRNCDDFEVNHEQAT